MPTVLTGLSAKLMGAVALCAFAFIGGWEVKGAFDAKAQLASADAAARVLKHEVAISQQLGAAGQAQADLDAGAFAQVQTKIQTVTRTLVQKAPIFVAPASGPPTSDASRQPLPPQAGAENSGGGKAGAERNENETAAAVVYGVPCGLVRLHDAAATGNPDPSQLSICAGKSDAEPASLDLSQFADVLVQNYGAFEANREQLIALQDWARQVQLWYADLKQKLESPR